MTTERYRVEVWEERDRLGIWVTDEATGDVVFEVWDDDARQHFEDGFLKPGKELKDSVLGYLRERKMIRKAFTRCSGGLRHNRLERKRGDIND